MIPPLVGATDPKWVHIVASPTDVVWFDPVLSSASLLDVPVLSVAATGRFCKGSLILWGGSCMPVSSVGAKTVLFVTRDRSFSILFLDSLEPFLPEYVPGGCIMVLPGWSNESAWAFFKWKCKRCSASNQVCAQASCHGQSATSARSFDQSPPAACPPCLSSKTQGPSLSTRSNWQGDGDYGEPEEVVVPPPPPLLTRCDSGFLLAWEDVGDYFGKEEECRHPKDIVVPPPPYPEDDSGEASGCFGRV